jgi:glycosyltransferase involved in cell wall biosynthesis
MKIVKNKWDSGPVPVSVILISLNEAHNMEEVLQNLSGWASEVFLVDSCSSDATVDIALKYGVHVVQRYFDGFGSQWNFALDSLPISNPWVMKLDPDERISSELKSSLEVIIKKNICTGVNIERRLWFMGSILPVTQIILRLWKRGSCRFTDVKVNEHPIVEGGLELASGYLEHHDSPNLDHWIAKQNNYTTTEAINQYTNGALAAIPKLLGSSLERRVWLKKYFWKFPGKYSALFVYHYLILGSWKCGRIGWMWSHLRVEVYRYWGYKKIEMDITGQKIVKIPLQVGTPDKRVKFYK